MPVSNDTIIKLEDGAAAIVFNQAPGGVHLYVPLQGDNQPATDPVQMVAITASILDPANRDLWAELRERFDRNIAVRNSN